MYVMTQSHSPSNIVTISLTHAAGWPPSDPAPWFVRVAKTPAFSIVTGAEGTTIEVVNGVLKIIFPRLDSQALLRFQPPAHTAE